MIILILAISGSSDALSRILMAEKTGEVKPNSLADPPAPTPTPTPLPIPKKSTLPEPEPKKNPPPPPKEKKVHDQQESQGPSKNEGSSKEKKDDISGVTNGPTGSGKVLVESCDASSLSTCHTDHDLVACLRHQKTDSKDLVLLVQNKGENNLSVLINVPASIKIGLKSVNLTEHGAEKISISGDATNNLKIVLNSGKESCVLEILSPIPGWNPLQQYAEHLTPINGAYVLFATVTIAACAWACCKFVRKGRRTDDGIPYQQLEMGAQSPKSSSVVVEPSTTGDGWDQGWDDDWDEEEAALRPSNNGPNGNVSSNGLTSRPANKKNDWDVDWDD